LGFRVVQGSPGFPEGGKPLHVFPLDAGELEALLLILMPIQISKDAGQVAVQAQQFAVAVEVLDELRVVDEAEVILVEQLLGVGDEVDEVADATVEGDAVLTHVVVAHVVSLDELTT
jgi:hypothetical protein